MSASAPDDIMLLIFEQLVCAEEAEDAWPAMVYDRPAAQAPFTVAAVCRRWRGLALATPTLWTYFGFPPADEIDERHLQRFELLRRRAGGAPIDVVFGWGARQDVKMCRSDASRSVFEGLLCLHLRWKMVVLHCSGCVHWGWTTDEAFQSLQWPLLESLSLAITSVPYKVPAAPRMRRMWFERFRNFGNESFIVGGYPALTMLSVWCKPEPILQELAQTFGEQLTELVLVDDCDGFAKEIGSASTRSVFPALQCLTLDDVCWLQHMDAPILKKLLITHRRINKVEREALRRFDHVRELQLCGMIKEAGGRTILADLSNITTLTFCPSRVLRAALNTARSYYKVKSGVLRELAALDPPIWPHLQRLQFASFNSQIQNLYEYVDAQDVVDFVSARNTRTGDPGDGGPTTARIIEVVANYPCAPDWLEDRLRALTAE